MGLSLRRLVGEWRPSAITLGAPAFPLAVLFGLNAVDELDRSAFAILLPDIRAHFGLSDASALALVAATTVAIVLIEVPLSFYADRGSRVRIATTGAAVWALFSVATGLATSVAMLVATRVGAGGGKAVVTPTHSSLLADYYEPAARVKVFSAHRLASSVGQIAGPLLAGLLGSFFGWRVPFLVFGAPTVVLVLLALRLREPVRGWHERRAAGGEAIAAVEEGFERPWATMRVLASVRTVRRIWVAAPFLGIALFGIPNLLSLVYEDVFGLDAAQRGAVAAGIEPLQIMGVVLAMPVVAKTAEKRPEFLLRLPAADRGRVGHLRDPGEHARHGARGRRRRAHPRVLLPLRGPGHPGGAHKFRQPSGLHGGHRQRGRRAVTGRRSEAQRLGREASSGPSPRRRSPSRGAGACVRISPRSRRRGPGTSPCRRPRAEPRRSGRSDR